MSLLPNLIAASVRFSHLPFDWVILFWHTLSIFLLLLACLQLSRVLFSENGTMGRRNTLGGTVDVTVAGTALYIADQYLNPRAFALFAGIFGTTAVIKKKYLQADCGFAAPLQFICSWWFLPFPGYSFWLWRVALGCGPSGVELASSGNLAQISFAAYREAVQTRTYFFLLQWQWYEWLGIFGPLAILYGLSRVGRKHGLTNVETLCRASIPSFLLFCSRRDCDDSGRLIAFARFQPLRSLQIVYVLLILIGGGFLGKWLLKGRAWLWLAVCLPLSAGMFYASRQLFPATPQIECLVSGLKMTG